MFFAAAYGESGTGSRNREKTHCPHGHEYTEANTYWQTKNDRAKSRRSRCCRECQKLLMQRKRFDPKVKEQERARTARWRERHPDKYREGYERSHAEKKRIIDEGRSGGCIKCGEDRLPCLDYHHRDGKADKVGDMARMRRFSIQRLLAEIAKCDVLCANCHRWHHHEERLKANNQDT